MVNEFINIGTKIPKEFATKVQFIGAKREGGKTWTAGVEEEECLQAGIPIVVIDGMHAHYGLRQKYAVPVIGPIDKHAIDFQPDIDITPNDGEKVAQMIVDFNQSCVLDLVNWTNDLQCEFVAEFLIKLYQLNKTPRHIFVEEADVFAPQSKITASSRKSRAAMTQIVRRGRGKGIGVTMITQRVQVIDKDIVTQSDLFLFGNFTDYHDLAIIKNYITSYGIGKQDVLKTLEKISKFNKGTFLLFSPSWLRDVKEFQVRKRQTYHAGRTPEFNESYDFKPLPFNTTPYSFYLNNIENIITQPLNKIKEFDITDKMNNIYMTIGGSCIGVLIVMVILYG